MQDLIIVGGGVMGLMTAWHASDRVSSITVLDRSTVGDPRTASFGRTRSIRSDYLDVTYAIFAREARRLWKELEAVAGERLLVDCGCLNLARADITGDLTESYAVKSFATLERLGLPREALDGAGLRARFPQFAMDIGRLDVEAGLVDVRAATRALQRLLAAKGVRIVENVEVSNVTEDRDRVVVTADGGTFEGRAGVVTAGHGVNGILGKVTFPLSRDRPSECKYVTPPADKRHLYTEKVFPVFAYLDLGIYGHPIVEGTTDAVKIGYYDPPDVKTSHAKIGSVDAFVRAFMPDLAGAAAKDVSDADGCDYDLVSDDHFILGAVPNTTRTWVGCGWRGTGYKYAPWVGRVLAELAVGGQTIYDIRRFSPERRFP